MHINPLRDIVIGIFIVLANDASKIDSLWMTMMMTDQKERSHLRRFFTRDKKMET